MKITAKGSNPPSTILYGREHHLVNATGERHFFFFFFLAARSLRETRTQIPHRFWDLSWDLISASWVLDNHLTLSEECPNE